MFYKVIALYNTLLTVVYFILSRVFLSYFRANQRVRDPLVFKVLLTIIWHMAKHELFRGRVIPHPYFYSSIPFPALVLSLFIVTLCVYLLQSYLAFPRPLEEGLFGRVGWCSPHHFLGPINVLSVSLFFYCFGCKRAVEASTDLLVLMVRIGGESQREVWLWGLILVAVSQTSLGYYRCLESLSAKALTGNCRTIAALCWSPSELTASDVVRLTWRPDLHPSLFHFHNQNTVNLSGTLSIDADNLLYFIYQPIIVPTCFYGLQSNDYTNYNNLLDVVISIFSL